MIYCTFYLGKTQFAFSALNIREIIPAQDIALVPGSDKALKGLINVRGQVVPVMDLRTRLGLKGKDHSEEHSVLITKTDQELASRACSKEHLEWLGPIETAGIDVDTIGDLIEYNKPLEEAPVQRSALDPRFVSGLIHTTDELILVLNLKEILTLNQDEESSSER